MAQERQPLHRATVRGSLWLAAFMTLSLLAAAAQQPAPSSTDAALAALPDDLRDLATRFLLSRRPLQQRLELAAELAEDESPPSAIFLVAALERERSAAVRRTLVGFVGSRADDVPDDRAVKLLQQIVATDRDAETVALAKDQLTIINARRSGKPLSPSALVPTATVISPAPEQVVVSNPSLRFVVLGDFGTCEKMLGDRCVEGGGDPQSRVARAMRRAHQDGNGARRFDFGITVGDNFYHSGVRGVSDPRWGHDWENQYAPLGIVLHAVLGNHDHYGGTRSINGQVQYSATSKSWEMSARYRPLVVGDGTLIQLFALDTELILDEPEQLAWLARMLEASKQAEPNAWRMVIGHHPVVSAGEHGRKKDLEPYRARLLPVLEVGGVHLYLAGHDHDLQLLKVEGIYQMVSGAGGKKSAVKRIPESIFCHGDYGFAVVEATSATLRLDYIGADGNPDRPLYSCAITKDAATGVLTDACPLACR